MSTQGILGDFGRPFFCLFFGMSTIAGMVGAGLPAMQTTRSSSETQSMPSQASQLPQLSVFLRTIRVGCWGTVL
ncbi:hypothetical protein C9382_07625 [Pseudomonas aylmerensis]|uniref:Uncharacterized protein n=1 Tax=Pseudomonas aylmerensis TaxID=1869229 RepID=A0A2T4G6F6_9PSED|nr:hypothetical protein BBG20_10815 [Pseudomonas aylmerensis]PTC31167.1 hypothetical protein C9382_07625 [Pseudomonas aylmerensis]